MTLQHVSSIIVLGIDPGLATCGYGVISCGTWGMRHLAHGAITTAPEKTLESRLHELHLSISKLLLEYHPTIIGVEEIFFCKNTKTAMSIGHARGVTLLTAFQAGIPLLSCTPLQVKQAVTSYGMAEKRQVQEMVKHILHLKNIPQPDDAADALAICIYCAQTFLSQSAIERSSDTARDTEGSVISHNA